MMMSRFHLKFAIYCTLVCTVITFSIQNAQIPDRNSDKTNLRNLRQNKALFRKKMKSVFDGPSYKESDSICCARGQWEAKAYVYANTLLTLNNYTMPVYYNGTGKIVFDNVNKKSYVSFDVNEFLPGFPNHQENTYTTIKDFTTGDTYSISGDGNCFKQPNSADIKIVCIPADAKKISEGEFGGSDVKTYQFSTLETLEIITTVTVVQNGTDCKVVMLSYAMIADGSLEQFVYDVDIVDITPGIKDPSILIPPKDCN